MSEKYSSQNNLEMKDSAESHENIEDFHNHAEVKPKVHFSLLSAIGIQYSAAPPIAIGIYLSLVVGLGGSPAYFWGFLLMGVMQLPSCLAAAELASAIPHSSGPAHWVITLASARYSRNLGYIMGWLTNAGWFFATSAAALYTSQITMALVCAANSSYTPHTWHTYLVYCGVCLLALIANLPRVFKITSYLLWATIFTLNGLTIWIFIALLVRAAPKQSAYNVFLQYTNESGWSDGMAFFLALLPSYACLTGFDNATHLTDEVENPTRTIPLVIICTYAMSVFTALPMIVVYEFCNVNPLSLLESVGNQPVVQLLLNGFRSLPLTLITSSIIVYAAFIATTAALISWSRLYWSFSRESALPFSGMTSKLTSRDSLPIYALCWNTVLVIGIGAISIGSSTAMNALLGAANVCIVSSLITAFVLVLYKGRHTLQADRWLNLGRWGTVIYSVAALWSLFMTVVLCIPLYLPVTPETMNWTSVVFIGVVVVAVLYWVVFFREKALPSLPEDVVGQNTYSRN